ncbi:MAG: threonine synthase [Proteobacteria bacterium]|nr:threonine synthase [Pseudomonadota bacterium]
MKYISTRGKAEPRTFIQAVIDGLSRDGGLLVPEHVPDFSGQLSELEGLSYQELALAIFLPFIDGEIPEKTVKDLIDKSYGTFSSSEVTPLRFLENVSILELFHGPTLAFKDVALQFLGNLFEEILHRKKISLNILGATSGDTGSAAIHGVRGKSGITIFMLHPKGKVSSVQERQMTTILDENVVNIAIEGTFDDGQRIVKEILNDLDFKDKYRLGTVNSINWVRVMSQIVYYFFAAFRFKEKHPTFPLVFSVPTGNFGDIYAGYMARKMGLPIEKLILATNENDILFRVMNSGEYKISQVVSTISPSMDIQVSSNFERFLFDILGQNGERVQQKMTELSERNWFSLSADQLIEAQSVFTSVRINTEQTIHTIKKYKKSGLTIDPHTAVGIAASEQTPYPNVICLATAHPAKFREAVIEATGEEPEKPDALAGIMDKETKCIVAKQNQNEVKRLIEGKLE